MTALNFYLTEECVLVSMDSLVVGKDNKPINFITKIFPLPHLNCVMCGTGSLKLILNWFLYIQEKIAAENIFVLNRAATNILPTIAQQLGNEHYGEIYHFGLDTINNKIVGYVFRQSNNFKPELLDYGLGIRPPDGIIEDVKELQTKINDPIELFIKIMEKQINYQKLSSTENTNIGGEIHLLTLTINNQTMWTVHRFSDFGSLFDDILSKCTDKI